MPHCIFLLPDSVNSALVKYDNFIILLFSDSTAVFNFTYSLVNNDKIGQFINLRMIFH